MTQQPQDLRSQTDALVTKIAAGAAGADSKQIASLVQAWLASVDDEDLVGLQPESLAPLLWEAFSKSAKRPGDDCQITTVRYQDGRGQADALLIVNEDMPYLVDSIVMALRRRKASAQAVLNAVLAVQRDAQGAVTQAARAGSVAADLESFVLVVLADAVPADELASLSAHIESVARDAAVVRRDSAAMATKLSTIAASLAPQGEDGQEAAAFLQWALEGGYEPFGYAYYRVEAGQTELVRDLPSRIGVLQDTSHPVYGTCLANIPGDPEKLHTRGHALSIVKADVEGTLHRDQPLDFIGVRDTDAAGKVVGEHCFVGLFSRGASIMPLPQLPFARKRVAQVLSLAGVRQQGFRAEKFREILESLPRTEAMEADPEWLAQVCSSVVSLYKQPRTRVFARRDVYGRHMNVLVYLPRERYSAQVSRALADALKGSTGASDVRWQTLVADGPLARVYLIATAARGDLDIAADIKQPLKAVLEGWHNQFEDLVDGLENSTLRISVRRVLAGLPNDYIAATAPQVAFGDLCRLEALGVSERITVRIEVDHGAATVRLYSFGTVPSLSRILPALHNAGVEIDREQAYSVAWHDGRRAYITSLMLDADSAAKLARPNVAGVAEELFEALFNDQAEDGRLNGLVIEAGLSMREVQLVRAYISYWRQAGSRFTVRYIADMLRKQPAQVRTLVEIFKSRFDPRKTEVQRQSAEVLLATLKSSLAGINHADTEEIIGSLAELVGATLRTNYYQEEAQTHDTIIFKFDSGSLDMLPEPRPFREIYVFSRRFEGVHLRGGPVARGGLRWSDRMEDYRTEVLGLVKAQMVKNAVIVPAGSKGGFVCKMMPPNAPREVVAAEGEAVYRLFIKSLLEVTDNRVRGEIVPPSDTVRYDGNDPYLVVAADKGTATFSDIANSIAVQRGFWLGDAFASGGSNGYDHKKMGITAKGAWEAVKRHFYEMNHDMNTTPFTVAGVGDMSGDVFGNGMLLSKQIKLLAAFDHRHIFLDPNPDTAKSFAERARMFALPRSSWEDYDRNLISQGGGVYPRNARTIELSPEIRAALDIQEDSLSPQELMHRILLAPVDLFYNGGIGTYIKASSETHAQVKDRANDEIRVNGSELRCKVVSEGGNLGATQAGRIEFASKGGRIFTDAIDNSAGVDCSDHEVNLKIWLDTEVNAGQLAADKRNQILNDMTGDVEELVLNDNKHQTHLLVREAQAQTDGMTLDAYAALIASLEAEGAVNRELEQLPSVTELTRRRVEGRGLTTPELAVVVANVKNRFKRLLAAEALTEQPWAEAMVRPYFPPMMVATRKPLDHPLANTILATVLANESVNRCGPLMIAELAKSHNIDEVDVIQAWAEAWITLNLGPVFDALDADSLNVPQAVSVRVDARSRSLQRAMIEGMLSVPKGQLHAGTGMADLQKLFADPAMVAKLSPANDAEMAAGLPAKFSQAWKTVEAIEGVAAFLFASLSVARPNGMDLATFLQVGMQLRGLTGIAALERGLKAAPGTPAQQQLRDYAQQALRRAQTRLLAQMMSGRDAKASLDAVIAALAQNGYTHAVQAAGVEVAPEQTMLEAWTLAEAANRVTLAA
jgi:glutamate dehydrogenase